MSGFDMGSVLSQIMSAANDGDFVKALQADPAKAIDNHDGIQIPTEAISGLLDQVGGADGIMKLVGSKDPAKAVENMIGSALGDGLGDLVGGLFGKK